MDTGSGLSGRVGWVSEQPGVVASGSRSEHVDDCHHQQEGCKYVCWPHPVVLRAHCWLYA